MSCTICLPSFRLFVILAMFPGSYTGSGASWFSWCTRSVTTICLQVKQLVVLPGYSAFFKCKEMSTVHGPRFLFLVLCPCAVCPCRCSTQISGLFIVVWLGFGPELIPSLFPSLFDVNQIVFWLSLRLVSQLQLPPIHVPPLGPVPAPSAGLVALISYDLVCA